ncbi:unnamed protein product [Rotaria sordida]|uniref:Uncharacterized protein n=1 Tax=Rotaria sordida TaxID=392033 RepID=A0A819SRS7_9BILA|nr:unnamed protein product [Rotaria sordida]CAF4066402.1 unnamed protein product [Rotaria sordida]
MKRKARIRDNSRRQSSKGALLDQLRARQKQASKKYRDKKKFKNLNGHQSSYKCRQSLGKALKRAVHSLPKDTNKRMMVVQHLAQNLNIISKTTHQHTRKQRSLSIELKELVIQFYQRDDITYQLPGKRDYVTVTDDNGESRTLQKRILLYNIRKTYQLFVNEYSNKNVDLSLTSFNELRPVNILINSYMPHHSCLCISHENVNLLIKLLSKHISCDGLNSLQEFTSMLVCDEQEEKCMFSCCHLCSHNFDNNIMKNVINPTKRIQWFQWVLQDRKTKKIEFNDTINQYLLTLKEKIEPFLNHVFIKRQQTAFFEKMKIIPNDEIICIQVDFSENFRLCMQNAVQNSYYSQDAVSLFTTYVWYAGGGGESFVYISNNLSHDKYCINASIDNLLKQLTQRFQHLQQIHIFSDRSSQQFKQKF